MNEIFERLGVRGVLLLRDLGSGELHSFFSSDAEKGRERKRVEPASTFKILNSLIALETASIEPSEKIPWDGSPTFSDAQQQAGDLRSAFQTSAVWFYRILARRIGRENYRRFLSACRYGNENPEGRLDQFWLEGPLQISPLEQLDFIERFWQEELPFEGRHFRVLKEMMILDSTGSRIFCGKTGYLDAPKDFGWFVGYESSPEGASAAVAQIDIPDSGFLGKRRELVERGLSWIKQKGKKRT